MFGDVNKLAKKAQDETVPRLNGVLDDAGRLLRNVNDGVIEARATIAEGRQFIAALRAGAVAFVSTLMERKS